MAKERPQRVHDEACDPVGETVDRDGVHPDDRERKGAFLEAPDVHDGVESGKHQETQSAAE